MVRSGIQALEWIPLEYGEFHRSLGFYGPETAEIHRFLNVKDRFVELVPGSNGPESVDVLKSTVRSISWMKVNPRWPSIWSATCAHSGHHRLQSWAYESKMVKSYAQNSECCSAHTQVTISTVKIQISKFPAAQSFSVMNAMWSTFKPSSQSGLPAHNLSKCITWRYRLRICFYIINVQQCILLCINNVTSSP